jgi:hypothetical protein
MNCANHPETSATAFCRECGKPLCEDCQRPALGSIYCAEHLPAAAVPPGLPRNAPPPPPGVPRSVPPPPASPYAAPYTAPAGPGVNPGLALMLGFIPGVGAIYNGQYAKGLIHALVFGLMISVENTTTNSGVEALVGIMLSTWVMYQAFEAYHTARKRRHGIAVEEFSSLFDIRPNHGRFPVGAVLLIVLGFVLLLDTTGIITMEAFLKFSPALLIVVGLYMLYARTQTSSLNASVHNSAPAPDNSASPFDGGFRR